MGRVRAPRYAVIATDHATGEDTTKVYVYQSPALDYINRVAAGWRAVGFTYSDTLATASGCVLSYHRDGDWESRRVIQVVNL